MTLLPDTVVYPKLTDLTVTSTLGDLLLHQVSLPLIASGKELMTLFTEDPVLPGVLLFDQGDFAGMISRQRFLAQMSRPYSLELFLERPLKVLYPFIQSDPLMLSWDLPIVEAAQRSLHRPTHLLYEPLVVTLEGGKCSILDVHQLLIAQAEIHRLTTALLHEKTQAHLAQSEKMSSLGRMIAGVSHEIKNPVNCISGNFDFLNQYVTDLTKLVKAYQQFYQQSQNSSLSTAFQPLNAHQVNAHRASSTSIQPERQTSENSEPLGSLGSETPATIARQVLSNSLPPASRPMDWEAIAKLENEIEIDFLMKDLPKLMQSVNLAAERMVGIVSSLRNFSRMDHERPQLIDIHKYIDGTLLILNNQLKLGIELIKDYAEVPLIQCFPGQISQVFMNLISNSVDALLEKQESSKNKSGDSHAGVNSGSISTLESSSDSDSAWQPKIHISTQHLQRDNQTFLQINIWDNGNGIPQELQDKIFDAFFTTKSIEKGTGLGLAISHQIVTQKHGGEIKVISSPFHGTEFEILLPYRQHG